MDQFSLLRTSSCYRGMLGRSSPGSRTECASSLDRTKTDPKGACDQAGMPLARIPKGPAASPGPISSARSAHGTGGHWWHRRTDGWVMSSDRLVFVSYSHDDA